jgi:acyl dehydratase
VYDGCTDIVFGIHSSPAMARALSLPGIVYQGTATLAMAVHTLLDREGDSDPHRVRALGCRFGGYVTPGTAVELRLLGRNVEEDETTLLLEVSNHEGRAAIRAGLLLLGP